MTSAQVLLIEDEAHKSADLMKRIEAARPSATVSTCASVQEAVLKVSEGRKYDLIVLDMALPTFSKSESGSGGVAQSVGGIEVLRALSAAKQSANIIIVTQYPEVTINGTKFKLSQVGKVVQKKYNQNVIGCILYAYRSPEWENIFDSLIGKAI